MVSMTACGYKFSPSEWLQPAAAGQMIDSQDWCNLKLTKLIDYSTFCCNCYICLSISVIGALPNANRLKMSPLECNPLNI